jgi:hypothetical protein
VPRGCDAYAQPPNGKGDAYSYCKACHPGARAKACWWRGSSGADLWKAADVLRLLAHARALAWGEALERLAGPDWPRGEFGLELFGSRATAHAAAWSDDASVS